VAGEQLNMAGIARYVSAGNRQPQQEQDLFFSPDYLLRRYDYRVEVFSQRFARRSIGLRASHDARHNLLPHNGALIARRDDAPHS